MHSHVRYGCMARKCKIKTQKTSMLKKVLSVTLINKCIFLTHNINSGRISFLLSKFRRPWCRPFFGLGLFLCTYWLMWRHECPSQRGGKGGQEMGLGDHDHDHEDPGDDFFCMIWTSMAHIYHKKAFLSLTLGLRTQWEISLFWH